MNKWLLNWGIVTLGLMLALSACKHDPMMPGGIDMNPVDTTGNPIDTVDNPIDTTGNPIDTLMNICDPEVVYFELDIQPLLHSNCAFSGCHDADSAQDGVDLSSYEQVIETADVRPFDLEGSDLYEVITEDDPDKVMPPSPRPSLNSDQINLIAKWILQGAENLICDPDATACDTLAQSYSLHVVPIIQTHCQGCHSGNTPSGGINLSIHTGVQQVALNGRLLGAITHDPVYLSMPQGGTQLRECEIAQIRNWIEDGAPNN